MGSAELSLIVKAKDDASHILRNVGLAAVALGTAVVVGAISFVKAAAEEEVGMKRLEEAMRRYAGDSLPDFVTEMEAYIAELEKMTAFSDNEARSAMTQLINLTGNMEEAYKRLPIAMDLARGANISLEQASKLVGKVSEENTTALKRLGLSFKEGATEAEVLLEVQKRFGGQAAAFAATAAGQWEILQNQISNFAEDIGKQLLPMVTAGITIVGELFGVITGRAPDAGAALTKAVGPETAKTIMGALAAIRDTAQLIFSGDLPAVFDRLVGFVGESVPKIAAQLLKWAGEFIAWVAPMIPPLLAEMSKLLNQALDWLVEHSDEIGAALVEWGSKFVEFITDVAIPQMTEHLPSITDLLIAFAESVPVKISNVFAGIGRGIVKAIGDGLSGAWNEFADAFREMLARAIASIDFWVGPFHISGSGGITVQMPTINLPAVNWPSFAGGGVVPGPIGAPMLATVHGGEHIYDPRTGGGGGSSGGGGITLVFNAPVYGMQDFDQKVRAAVRDAKRAGGFRGVVS